MTAVASSGEKKFFVTLATAFLLMLNVSGRRVTDNEIFEANEEVSSNVTMSSAASLEADYPHHSTSRRHCWHSPCGLTHSAKAIPPQGIMPHQPNEIVVLENKVTLCNNKKSLSCSIKLFERLKRQADMRKMPWRIRSGRESQIKEELSTTTQILSPGTTKVTNGGILNLVCVVREHVKPPAKIWWWINGTRLDLSKHRGGILLETVKMKKSSTSSLTIKDVGFQDAAVYQCRAIGLELDKQNENKRDRDEVLVVVEEVVKHNLFFEDNEGASPSTKLTNTVECFLIGLFLSTNQISVI